VVQYRRKMVIAPRGNRHQPATPEGASKITDKDIDVQEGKEKYSREVAMDNAEMLGLFLGHVRKGNASSSSARPSAGT
jgi:hypothetical protein